MGLLAVSMDTGTRARVKLLASPRLLCVTWDKLPQPSRLNLLISKTGIMSRLYQRLALRNPDNNAIAVANMAPWGLAGRRRLAGRQEAAAETEAGNADLKLEMTFSGTA